MDGSRKHILDSFQKFLNENYNAYCDRHGVVKSENRLVTFMIDQDLIPSTQIQRYSVLREFEKLKNEAHYLSKTQSVNTIAHRYNISERTVWNILKSKKDEKKKIT